MLDIVDLFDLYSSNLHSGEGGQYGLDLSQFYTKASKLYLIILSSNYLEISVTQPASVISGFVNSLAVEAYEFCIGLLVKIIVAQANAPAAYVYLSDNAHRQLIAIGINYVLGNARRRLSYCDDILAGQVVLIAGDGYL